MPSLREFIHCHYCQSPKQQPGFTSSLPQKLARSEVPETENPWRFDTAMHYLRACLGGCGGRVASLAMARSSGAVSQSSTIHLMTRCLERAQPQAPSHALTCLLQAGNGSLSRPSPSQQPAAQLHLGTGQAELRATVVMSRGSMRCVLYLLPSSSYLSLTHPHHPPPTSTTTSPFPSLPLSSPSPLHLRLVVVCRATLYLTLPHHRICRQHERHLRHRPGRNGLGVTCHHQQRQAQRRAGTSCHRRQRKGDPGLVHDQVQASRQGRLRFDPPQLGTRHASIINREPQERAEEAIARALCRRLRWVKAHLQHRGLSARILWSLRRQRH